MRGAIPPLPNTSSWRDAQLKHRDNLTFYCILWLRAVPAAVLAPGGQSGNFWIHAGINPRDASEPIRNPTSISLAKYSYISLHSELWMKWYATKWVVGVRFPVQVLWLFPFAALFKIFQIPHTPSTLYPMCSTPFFPVDKGGRIIKLTSHFSVV
jgi:hypothetical protein